MDARTPKAFDVLKEALVTAPVFGYPEFKREFMQEADASLYEVGAVLSHQDETGMLLVIACMSQSLCPSERSKHNYSSAILEMLALNGQSLKSVYGFWLGSKFQV